MRLSAVITFLFLGGLLLHTARAQQVTPFVGQGIPPPGGADVFVSAALNRLIDVDDVNYRFEALMFILLTWSDPRAKPTMIEATANSTANNGTCEVPCTDLYFFYAGSPCCSHMWLPHLEFLNARGFSQDRVVRYGIQFGPGNSTAVAWWAYVSAEFYTNLQFKAFPFDSQRLIVQVGYANPVNSENEPIYEPPVRFLPGTTTTNTYMPKAGDDISGWIIKNMSMIFYNITEAQIYATSKPSNPNDPFPIHPVDPTDPVRFVSPLWRQGFAFVLDIERIALYYVLTAIIPIALNVWLALLVFTISPKHLDTRLGIIVTLFLSLTALLLVIGDNLPQSSIIVPTQQLCLLSYFVLAFVSSESIFSYKIVNSKRRKETNQKTKWANKQFSNRWRTLKRNARMPRESRRGDGGIDKNSAGKCVDVDGFFTFSWMPWMGRMDGPKQPTSSEAAAVAVRKSPKEPTAGGRGEVAVDMPQTSNLDHPAGDGVAPQLTAPEPPRMVAKENRGVRFQEPDNNNNHRTDDMERYQSDFATHRNSTMEFIPFGGGMHDSDSEDSFASGPANMADNDFVSSDDDEIRYTASGRFVPPDPEKKKKKSWYKRCMGNHTTIWTEMWREAETNQDYALYVALKLDKAMFWITLIVYNVALVIIFAINAQYEPTIYFSDAA